MIDAQAAGLAAYDFGAMERAALNSSTSEALGVIAPVVARIRERALEVAPGMIRDLLSESGDSAGRVLAISRPVRALRAAEVSSGYGFNADNPRAKLWVKSHAAELVSSISEETRTALNAIMQQAFAEHLAPRETASLIRDVIGLDPRRADAVSALRQSLLAAEPGTTVYAGSRAIVVPETITADFVSAQSEKYGAKLLRDRAIAISRTETMAVSNAGQQLLWLQASDSGLLDVEKVERELMITDDDRLCEICEGADGTRAPLTGAFVIEGVGSIENPPVHPLCRCTQAIVDREDS